MLVHGRRSARKICERCYVEPVDVCRVCERSKPCVRAGTARAICRSCLRSRTRGCCLDCGRVRTIHCRVNGQPQCTLCRHKDLESKGICSRCGQSRRLTRLANFVGLCEVCAGIKSEHVCRDCGLEDRLYKDHLCARCNVRRALQPHIENAAPGVAVKLDAYLAALIATRQPRSTLRWMHGSVAYGVLIEILASRCPLEHEALDALKESQAIEHLRAALVVHGALPPRDAPLFRFGCWLEKQTAKVARGEDRRHLKAWAHWHLVNDLNYRRRSGKLTSRSVYYARSQVSQSIAFVEWLRGQDLQLADCEQSHVDDWFATGSKTRVRVTSFLRWSVKNGVIAKVTIPRADQPPAYRRLQETHRRAVIDRLIHESSLDSRDRVAGLLVLIYGQPIARIARLRLDDVQVAEQGVLLRLGKEPIVMVEPVACLLSALVREPHGGAVTAAARTPWLFPGKVVGQHLDNERLRRRLKALGIPGRASRASALLPLAREVPAPVLAEMLGLSDENAAGWAKAAGSDYARYAASRA